MGANEDFCYNKPRAGSSSDIKIKQRDCCKLQFTVEQYLLLVVSCRLRNGPMETPSTSASFPLPPSALVTLFLLRYGWMQDLLGHFYSWEYYVNASKKNSLRAKETLVLLFTV